MKLIPEVWRQARLIAAGVVAEIALAAGLCAVGALICLFVGVVL